MSLALVLAVALPLAGKTVAIDPGHNGGNAAHAAQIARLVDAGTLWKACDTVGAATGDGYAEHAYDLDVSLRLARALRARGARLAYRHWPGEHETEYWSAHTVSYLRFYARALARCRR